MLANSASPSPINRSATVSPSAGAEGYLLLTIQHAQVRQIFDGETMTLARGEMRVECISMPIPPEIGHQTANPFAPSPSDPAVPTHDFWLVLHVGSTFEMPLIPETYLVPTPLADGISYTIPSPHVPNASVQIVLPSPASSADMEDLDSFEVLLKQYQSLAKDSTALSSVVVPPLGGTKVTGAGIGEHKTAQGSQTAPEDMRGKVVLINEETGEVVGELDQTLDVEEDKRLGSGDQGRPVVLDFGNVVEGYAPKVTVQTIKEEDMDDWLLRGAHNISRGILTFSSWTQRMMTSGSEAYIRRVKPNEEPTKFSPTTKANIRRAHNASVKTVNVTKTTVGMINNAIIKVVDKTYDNGVKPALDAYDRMNADPKFSADGKPPVPPRTGSTKVAPAVPPKPGALQTNLGTPPRRTPSPLLANEGNGYPSEKQGPPAYTEATYTEPETMASQSAGTTPTSAKTKRPWLNRIVMAGEVVLTSLEATAHDLINTGTAAASSAAGHKYGPEAGHATALLGGSVRNVAVVYIDVRGVGRRALLKSTAKGFVKAKMRNGEVVRLQGDGREANGVEVEAGEVEPGRNGETVIGMMEVPRREQGENELRRRRMGEGQPMKA